MVYLIGDVKMKGRVTLVKATDETEIQARLILRDGEMIVGRLTDNEITVLESSSFVVMQA